MMGMNFHSAEQAYQYSKAIQRGQPDVADDILKSPSPLLAKSKSKFLKYNANWNKDQKTALMKQILQAKAEQVPDFKDALLSSARQAIVVADRFEYEWATGLTSIETTYTQKKNWPGKNLLGTVLEDIRAQIFSRSSSSERNKSKKK